MSKDMYNAMRRTITAAKELGYPQIVISRLRSANTESELTRIMHTAREEAIRNDV